MRSEQQGRVVRMTFACRDAQAATQIGVRLVRCLDELHTRWNVLPRLGQGDITLAAGPVSEVIAHQALELCWIEITDSSKVGMIAANVIAPERRKIIVSDFLRARCVFRLVLRIADVIRRVGREVTRQCAIGQRLRLQGVFLCVCHALVHQTCQFVSREGRLAQDFAQQLE